MANQAAREQIMQVLLTGQVYAFDGSKNYSLVNEATAMKDEGLCTLYQEGTYFFVTHLPYKPGEEPA
jgi:hypothetical protein